MSEQYSSPYGTDRLSPSNLREAGVGWPIGHWSISMSLGPAGPVSIPVVLGAEVGIPDYWPTIGPAYYGPPVSATGVPFAYSVSVEL